jgi:tetratricopeptide (TPR) repeat protein
MKDSTFILFLIIAVSLFLFSSCGENAPEQEPIDETAVMAAKLDSIANHVDPMLNEFAGRARVNYLKNIPVPESTEQRFTYLGTLAQEMIYAGDTEEAIDILESLREQLEESDQQLQQQFTENVLDLLALAYLRLGEQQNCILNHSADSCLFPIRGEGVHTLTTGSEKAIEYYERLLAEWSPGDLELIWLLNIAYMTLGKHPHEVPDQWLIPAEHFEENLSFNRFHDIAPQVRPGR